MTGRPFPLERDIPTRGTRSLYVQDLMTAIERSLMDGNWPAAAAAGNILIDMGTRDPAALTAVAATHEIAEQYDAAVAMLCDALALAPENANAWLNLGMITGRGHATPDAHRAALLAYTMGAYHNPTAILPAWGAAVKFFSLGHRAEAEAWRREAAERFERFGNAPANRGVAPMFNLSFMLLCLAQLNPDLWPTAFRAYEARLQSAAHTLSDRAATRPPAGVPRWTDPATRPKRLAIFFEQGLGDTLMVARYAVQLAEQGVEVVFEVQNPLVRLFRTRIYTEAIERDTFEGNRRLSIIGEDEPLPPDFAPDAYAWAMSLPGLCWQGADAIPTPPLARRGARAASNLVAFSWRGSAANRSNHVKSCPVETYRAAAEMIRGMGYTPVAINRDEARPEWLEAPPWDLADLEDTAAVYDGCAAVVSICTSGAHLAGAMHVPTLLVLSAEPDWRWGYADPVLPWYPTVTALRQTVVDHWADVAERLPAALAALLPPTPAPL